MDLNELYQKTRASGNPKLFDSYLDVKLWEAREDFRRRRARVSSFDEILMKYGAVSMANLGEPSPENDLIEGFIPEGEPVTLFGGWATLKSYVSTLIGVAIASDEVDEVLGRKVEKHGVVIEFDAEMNENRFNERVQAICRGLGISVPKRLVYRNVKGMLPSESFPLLHEFIDEIGAIAVVIDSWGVATPGYRAEEYSEQRDAGTRFIDPILNRGVTPIVIEHKPHQGDNVFGSVLKSYNSRAIFQTKERDGDSTETSDDGLTVIKQTKLVTEKMSHGPDGWGFNLITTFYDVLDEETGDKKLQEVVIRVEGTTTGGARGGKPDSKTLIIEALEDGNKTRDQITEYTGLKTRTLERVMPGMEQAGTIHVVGKEEGKGGSFIYSLAPPEDGDEGEPDPDPEPDPEEKIDPSDSGEHSSAANDIPRDKTGGRRKKDSNRRGSKNEKKPKVTLLTHARANQALQGEIGSAASLIYRQRHVDEVLWWLAGTTRVAVDCETYGEGTLAPERKRKALSFVHSQIRLIQLASGKEVYLIDTKLLKDKSVVQILEALKGKVLLGHNLIFDLPRIRRAFGVNLLDEGVADTMVASRLCYAGDWTFNEDDDPVTIRHALGEVLRLHGVVDLPKDSDHRWGDPLTRERLTYAIDDVRHLAELYDRLVIKIKEDGLERGYGMFKKVYRMYMHQQYNGQPIDKDRLAEYIRRLEALVSEAQSKLAEHMPEHPEGGEWSWGNKLKYDPKGAKKKFEEGKQKTPLCYGRNGALRALADTGVKLKDLKKPTRISWIKRNPGKSLLLEALHDYYIYSDMLSDCKDWLAYYVKGDRIYANINPFSQVTGRSAYSNPALQNTPKVPEPNIGFGLRDCIKPQEGSVIVKADYAAQELRILAEVVARHNGDTKLVEAFAQNDKDPHILVAEKIAGRPIHEDDEDYSRLRKLGKRANYGFSYGAGAKRYQGMVFEDTYEVLTLEQAQDEQKAYRKTWPGVLKWQRSFGSRDGSNDEDWYVTSFLGRRRYVSPKVGSKGEDREPNYCDRLNGPIQCGDADMLYRALEYLIADQDAGTHADVKIIATTHDEIVLEAPSEKDQGVKGWLEGAMRKAAGDFMRGELAGPDCVEGDVYPSWGGQ